MVRSSRFRPSDRNASDIATLLAGSSLVIDQSEASHPHVFTVSSEGDSFEVVDRARQIKETHTYTGISDLTIVGSGLDDAFVVNAAPLGQGAFVALDGGGGLDALSIDLSALSVNLQRREDGTITGDHLTFRNFESVQLRLGQGTNNVMTGASNDLVDASAGGIASIDTGGGDDQIFTSTAGKYEVDGGDGNDFLWMTVAGHRTLDVVLDLDQQTLLGSAFRNVETLIMTVVGGAETTFSMVGDYEAKPLHVVFNGKGKGTPATFRFDGSSLHGA